MSLRVTTDLLMIRRCRADTNLYPANFMSTVAKSQTRLTATHWEFAGNTPNIKHRGSTKECIPFKIKLLQKLEE